MNKEKLLANQSSGLLYMYDEQRKWSRDQFFVYKLTNQSADLLYMYDEQRKWSREQIFVYKLYTDQWERFFH